MTAEEARKISGTNQSGELNEIYEMIRRAAIDGRYDVWVKRILHADVLDMLEQNGFKISESEGAIITIISWDESSS